MKKDFVIYNGYLSVKDDYVQIDDHQPRWFKIGSQVSIISAILYGVLIIIKYFRTSDPFDLWPGIAMVAMGMPAMVVQSKIIYDRRIDFRNIRRIIIKRNLTDQLIADIILHNGKKRRVILDQNDLRRFESAHLHELTEVLDANNLAAEIK
jgi:hypothetical protein